MENSMHKNENNEKMVRPNKRRKHKYDNLLSESHSTDMKTFEITSYTESNIGLKPTNEDRTVKVEKEHMPGPFFGIFDGHGGMDCAEFLKDSLPKIFYEKLEQYDTDIIKCINEPVNKRETLINSKMDLLERKKLLEVQKNEVNDMLHPTNNNDMNMESLLDHITLTLNSLEEALKKIELELNDINVVYDKRFDHYFPTATTEIEDNDNNTVNSQILTKSMKSSFLEADEQILKYKKINDGSTGVVVLFIFQTNSVKAMVANAGDCRVVLCRDDKAIRLTTDHKPDSPQERKRIINAGGYVGYIGNIARVCTAAGVGLDLNQEYYSNEDDNNSVYLSVSRGFGDKKFKEPSQIVTCEPEIKIWKIKNKDLFMIIACDGIWDVLTDIECVEIVRKNLSDAKAAAKKIINKALEKGSKDNVTVTVILFLWNIREYNINENNEEILEKKEINSEKQEIDMFNM